MNQLWLNTFLLLCLPQHLPSSSACLGKHLSNSLFNKLVSLAHTQSIAPDIQRSTFIRRTLTSLNWNLALRKREIRELLSETFNGVRCRSKISRHSRWRSLGVDASYHGSLGHFQFLGLYHIVSCTDSNHDYHSVSALNAHSVSVSSSNTMSSIWVDHRQMSLG